METMKNYDYFATSLAAFVVEITTKTVHCRFALYRCVSVDACFCNLVTYLLLLLLLLFHLSPIADSKSDTKEKLFSVDLQSKFRLNSYFFLAFISACEIPCTSFDAIL